MAAESTGGKRKSRLPLWVPLAVILIVLTILALLDAPEARAAASSVTMSAVTASSTTGR